MIPSALAEDAPDPEAELRARLLLYRAHRDAGQRLAADAERRIGLFRREPSIARAAAVAGARPADAPRLDPARLPQALARLVTLAPVPEPPPGVVPRIITLTERAAIIRAALRDAPAVVLQDLLRGVARPGRHRHHLPGHAGAHEAARDRRGAGGAVGTDRGPVHDRRGASRGRTGARWTTAPTPTAPLDETLESFA